jgi:hypothetical protein
MSVIINSTIKTNALGRWYIELNDTSEEDHMVICLDVNEYALKIEEIGQEYGNDIEIVWSSEDGVTPEQINEVRMQMNAYEAEREAREAANAAGGGDAPITNYAADGTPTF